MNITKKNNKKVLNMLKNLSIKCGLLIKTKNKTKATLKSILKSILTEC